MTMPFKAIISDLDGTLLNGEHRIGEFTIQTLSQLAEKGVDIYFATGRNYPDVKHLIKKVPVDEAMLVTSNGARANFLSGKTVLNHYLPENLAKALMSVPFDPLNVCLNSYQGDDWFINVDIEALKKYHQDSGYCYKVVDFQNHHGRETEKVFYIGKTPADLAPNKNVSKANALDELVTHRGYQLSDCIAFGDGLNDKEMLARAGKGCVMGNADKRLKALLPEHEVIGENKDEAVACYLRKLFNLA